MLLRIVFLLSLIKGSFCCSGDIFQPYTVGTCTFHNNDTCGYTLEQGWEIHIGPFLFHTRRRISNGSDDGFYAFANTDIGNLTIQQNPSMKSQQLPAGTYCISFAYIEPTGATLVELKTISLQSANTTVWTVNKRSMPDWKNVSVSVNSNETFQVAFVVHLATINHVGIDNIQIEKACDNLTLQHGNVSLLNQTAAQFTCDIGYKLKGQGSSVCQHGTWSKLPLCEPVDCHAPHSIADGNVTSQATTYPSNATYTCLPGYKITGDTTIQCQSNGQWTQGHASCNPIDCKTVPVLTHGRVTSTTTTYQSVATYTCNSGYNLTGNKTIQCLSSGQWSKGNATCNPVDCKTVPGVTHGRATSTSTTFQSVATYTCDSGYNLTGNKTIQCMSSGQWSQGNTTCNPVDCKTAPVVTYGRATSTTTTYQSVATYTCNSGYNLAGNKTIQCLSSGHWSQGNATCNPVDCKSVPVVTHGRATSTSTTFQSVATYTCDSGYNLTGNKTIQCMSNGQWSYGNTTCNPVDCKTVHVVTHGRATSTSTTYQSVATYTCDSGYNLTGNKTIQCMSSGQWSQGNTTCNPVDCKTVPVVAHGRVTSITTTYQSVATYTCDSGYHLTGNNTMQCMSNGQWSQGNTTCKPVDCRTVPVVAHGRGTATTTTYQSVATYSCVAGYNLTGNKTIQCMSSGQWSQGNTTCNPVDCRTVPVVNHGSVTSTTTTYQSVATYTCDSGYHLTGNRTIQCMRSGHWSQENATCNPVDCSTVLVVAHGRGTATTTTYESVATYICDSGYNLTGNNTIQCMSTGQWSQGNTTCNPADCNTPSTIDHGNVTAQRTTYQSIASYFCDPGYNIVGNRTIHCMSNGNWSNTQATCKPGSLQFGSDNKSDESSLFVI